jgi:ABC-type dipeptide/oligopeptide/nickel transport system ATPase component
MSILFITHDLGVIAQMAQYVVVMYLGRVMEKGPVDAIFHNPKHPYTQALLRSIPSAQKTTKTKLPTITVRFPIPSISRKAAHSIRVALMQSKENAMSSCLLSILWRSTICQLFPLRKKRG